MNIGANDAASTSGLSEQVLQILPTDSEGKLEEVSRASEHNAQWIQTNVGDVELTVIAAHVAATLESATATGIHAAAVTAWACKPSTALAHAAARSIKSRLGFAVLNHFSIHFRFEPSAIGLTSRT